MTKQNSPLPPDPETHEPSPMPPDPETHEPRPEESPLPPDPPYAPGAATGDAERREAAEDARERKATREY